MLLSLGVVIAAAALVASSVNGQQQNGNESALIASLLESASSSTNATTSAIVKKSCYPHCRREETFDGPSSPAAYAAWSAQWQQWRTSTLKRVKYQSKVYDSMLLWTQTSFIQPQMMAHEAFFFDHATHSYTVDRYVRDVTSRYGGIDSVLIWPTYPNIGIDARNQFDMIRDMPDGFAAAVRQLQDRHNISVLLPYNPWDNGTRPEATSDAVALAALLKATGARGFNGDTLEVVDESFWQAALHTGGPTAIEPEEGGDEWSLWYTKLGWGYWTPYSYVPAVDRWKYLEHRHLTHVCERWARDRHDGLQAAFFNGCGYESWENIWGTWNQISDRDAAAIERVATILRFAGALFGGGNSFGAVDFVPHDPVVQSANGVFATRFEANAYVHWGQRGVSGTLGAASSVPYTAWTIVNRDPSNAQFTFSPTIDAQQTCFDLYFGVPITIPATLSIEGQGYDAVLCVPQSRASDPDLLNFLQGMQSVTSAPLASFSTTVPILPQTITVYANSRGGSTSGMSHIAGGNYAFSVTGIEIEGQQRPGIDFQYQWESYPQLTHFVQMNMPSFWIDTYPVTNSRFAQFLNSSGYVPVVRKNFLRDWSAGTYPAGWGNKPVTWVSHADATAYCKFKGARLPNEWEWQYAAQGTDGRTYPWGSSPDPTRVPTPFLGRVLPGPDDVDAHPTGQSPFGVQDLVGNVWQWTNVFEDAHTRAASLKGGCYYQPQGSMWYFPNTLQVNQHGKFLLVDDGLDRAATLSFRCVMD
jgi:iron(II)-dependent oxidoreductase